MLLSRARAAEQKQLADAEKKRADKMEEEVRFDHLIPSPPAPELPSFARSNSSGKSWTTRLSNKRSSSTSCYHAVTRYAHIPNQLHLLLSPLAQTRSLTVSPRTV